MVENDPLSPELRSKTFTFGTITFGSNVGTIPAGLQSYSTSVNTTNTDGTPLLVEISAGIDQATGVVTWTFLSIDPSTGQLPLGVNDGFLPVENGTGRGIGSVSFDVTPKAGLVSGTTISNTVTVVFDTNAPIATNTTTNTIDAGAPTSHVRPLPAVEKQASFPVSWTGTNDPHGSGIAHFDVYVLTDGGPFVPFLQDTTATTATFAGAPGHSYAFYSAATGNVGNRQPTPKAAQAVTKVAAPALTIAGPGTVRTGQTYTLSLMVDGHEANLISSWTITWGQGVVQTVEGHPASVTHVYKGPGTRTITAPATIDGKTFAANTVKVVVQSAGPPIAAALAQYSLPAGPLIALRGLARPRF